MAEEIILPPSGELGREIKEGQRVRITQVEGQQVADYLSFALDDPRERLSMYFSRGVHRSWKLTEGQDLYSNLARPMWAIEEDRVQDNYCGGGNCNPYINEQRYGRGDAPTCEANLLRALKPWNLDRWAWDPDTVFNVFMNVTYDGDGAWEIREPKATKDDFIVLRALMPQILAISNCPQLLNPCNGFSLKPLKVEILD